MAHSEGMRLIVDGVDLTDDCDGFEWSTPRAVHEIPLKGRRVLGPASFTILISNPSERLYALVDDGKSVHEVKLIATAINNSITHPTHFQVGWAEVGGARWMFGSLAPDREREAKWVEELPATVSTTQAEGN